jgi:hypothetical protein
MHATIAKLAIDWLSLIPFTIHSVLQTALLPSASGPASIERVSYSDIVKYNTISHASSFSRKFFGAFVRQKTLFDPSGESVTAIDLGRTPYCYRYQAPLAAHLT